MLVDTTEFSADRADKFVGEINRGKHKISSEQKKISSHIRKILLIKLQMFSRHFHRETILKKFKII